jgi:ArsR family transcriptional regulator
MKRSDPPFPRADPAALLASLAEPIRLRVLRLLDGEELTVGEIARVVQLPQSTVSRHLKVLLDRGWLARRSAGTATLYQLVLDDLAMDARALWLAVRPQVGSRPEHDEDRRRLAAVLAERRLDSESFFGRVGGEWDAVRASLFGSDFTARALLSLIPRGWVLADLGCGTGNASELLAPHADRVIAVDQSKPMLAAARKRLAAHSNVRFAAGSLDKLPLPARSVDAAVCILVLHHLDDPVGALREMARVLRTERGGGVALIVDMLEHDRAEYRQTMGHRHLGFAPEGLRAMLKDAGLSEATVQPLPSDPSAKGPGLLVATGRIAEHRKRTR